MDTIELQKQLDAMQMAYKEMLIFLEKKLNTIEEYKEKVKAQRQLIDDKNNLLDRFNNFRELSAGYSYNA